MMVEYIDAHRDRFGVGPICRTLGGVPGLGFIGERGYRAFRRRGPSRRRARHEALARDVMEIHSDFFMFLFNCLLRF